MADRKISELVPLTGALNVADALPIADDSASQTKKISPKALLEQGLLLIADNSIPGEKINASVQPDSISALELKDRSVTAVKLDDNSSGVVGAALPATGVRVGQVALETTDNKFYCWDGADWVAVKAGGSVNTINGSTGPLLQVAITQTGDEVTIASGFVGTSSPAQFIAGPTGAGGAVTARAISGDDLPTASAVEKGAVEVSGGGLKMNGDIIEIDNSIGPSNGTFNLCDVDENGLVVAYKAIESSDLPVAATGSPGIISPGIDLVVDASGALNHVAKGAPGTFTKVTTDGTGHVVSGSALAPEDLPDIPGDKVTGTGLDGAVINDRSITELKLSDYSTCLIQEGTPSADYKIGQFWFTPSTNQLRVYTRGSAGDRWESIGFGALQQQNLRWGGTCNADTSTITTLTDIGVSEGLEAGDSLPTPTDELSGLYFVVDTAGSGIGIPNVNNEACTEGDWILYINQAQGALHLDIAAGGGGGGGASKLNDLLDVEITDQKDKELLQYDSFSGRWKNVDVISGGTF